VTVVVKMIMVVDVMVAGVATNAIVVAIMMTGIIRMM